MDYFIKQATLSKLASLRLAINYVLRSRMTKSALLGRRRGVSTSSNMCGCSTAPGVAPPPAPTLKNPKSILSVDDQPTPAPNPNNNIVMRPIAQTNNASKSVPTGQPATTSATNVVPPPTTNTSNAQPTPQVAQQPQQQPQQQTTTPPKQSTPPEPQLPMPGIEDKILGAVPNNLYNAYGEEPTQDNPSWNVRNYYYGSNSLPETAEQYYNNMDPSDPRYLDYSARIVPDEGARAIPLVDEPLPPIPRKPLPSIIPDSSPRSTRLRNNNFSTPLNYATTVSNFIFPRTVGPVLSTANLMWNNRNKLKSQAGSWFNFNESDEDLDASFSE